MSLLIKDVCDDEDEDEPLSKISEGEPLPKIKAASSEGNDAFPKNKNPEGAVLYAALTKLRVGLNDPPWFWDGSQEDFAALRNFKKRLLQRCELYLRVPSFLTEHAREILRGTRNPFKGSRSV